MNMHLEWILSPLTLCGLIVAGMTACLVFCVSTSMRMRRENRRIAETFGQSVAAISVTVDQIQKTGNESRLVSAVPVAGLNLTRRAQALRMHRRGESLPTIAAALQTPRNEIELLLKLHG